MKRLFLTKPPTSNLIYRVGRGRVYLSQEARNWRSIAQWSCREQLGSDNVPFEGQVEVNIQIVGARLDFDNSLKLLMDSMQGSVYVNDRQVTKAIIEMIREPNAAHGRGTVIVTAWERGKELVWNSQEQR